MISDDERREVSARLRATKAECESRDYPWMVEDLLQSLGFKRYEDAEDGIFERLADLIDRPTCRIGYVPGSADRSCSACGVTFSTGTYQGGDHEEHEFMFCPNCGAEVKDDAEPNLKEN